MDPILESKLLGIGTPYSGTNIERNELIGLIRRMIKENKYTVDYILNYVQSLGYQYQMASDIFQELTGMNPKVIVNSDEYYQNPNFVPAMTLAWGYKKSTKSEAYYVVPFEYGYSVMFKNEKDVPESQFQFITIDEAVNKLKSLVTKVFTINKIITDNCLDKEDIQLNSNTVHNVNNPYFSTPINEMKQAYINKVIDESQFEKKAFRLVAEEKITTKEAEDAMKWLDDLQKERNIEELENVEFGNIKNDDKMKIQEENKQLEGSVLEFEDVVEEIYSTIGDEYANKNKLRRLFYKNKSFFKGLNKEQAAERLYELYLGFSENEISGKDKYVKKNKIKSSKDLKVGDIVRTNGSVWVKIKEIINNEKAIVEPIHKDDIELNKYPEGESIEFLDDLMTEDDLQKQWKENYTYSSLKKKARNWLVRLEMTKEMNDLEKLVDENGEFDAEEDTPVEFQELVEKFCDKLFTYKDEIAKKIGEDAASEFDDIVTALKYDGPCSTDQFNYMLNDLYDFCDNLSIWLETHGRIEASLKKKAKKFKIMLSIPFGKYHLIDWEAESKEQAKKEFIDNNPYYANNKKGIISVDEYKDTFNNNASLKKKISGTKDYFEQVVSVIDEDRKDYLIAPISAGWDEYQLDAYIAEMEQSKDGLTSEEETLIRQTYEDYKKDINASLKKKAADKDIELDDIKEKDVIKDTIDEINDTDFNELVKEETPQEYLEDESKNEQVNKVNEKVSKIIDEFTSKFDDFTKYKLQMSTYKLQILNQGSNDTSLQPIEDTELNAQAILQIILTIAPIEDLENSKKALAIFSINKDKVLFNGTLRMEGNTFVAFSEEGLDSIFTNDEDKVDITDELI